MDVRDGPVSEARVNPARRPVSTASILVEVQDERMRQDIKWGSQRHLAPEKWVAILGEEFGETARAVLEHDPDHEREELIQVAAVAVARVEAIDAGR